MSDALTVSALERGRIRVFQLDMDLDEVAAIKNPLNDTAPTGAAVAQLIGLDWLEDSFIEIFPVDDLAGLGLAAYLIQGNGVGEAEIAPYRPHLDAVTGVLLIVYSSAFDGKAANLRLSPRVKLIGVFDECRPDVSFTPLPSDSAQGLTGTTTDSTAKPGILRHALMFVVLALPIFATIIGIFVFGVMR